MQGSVVLKPHQVELVPMAPFEVPGFWARLLEQLDPPEAVFGPECRVPRPRAHDTYYHIVATAGLAGVCADAIGIAYTQAPSSTTRVFALGLYREYRGRGLGPIARDALVQQCFADAPVLKVESEVYAVNAHSLGALHGRHARLRPEGRQRATVVIAGAPVDRLLYGITRAEWLGLGEGDVQTTGPAAAP